jgi:CheY-like chemotaxis protein
MAGELILIVDDTPVNLKLTRLLLAGEGFKTITAASAEEAMELLRTHHPALVLADIQLPGMDGLEMARRIKHGQTTADIGVIALTAYASPADQRKAMDAGCDGYITKPIDTREMGARLRAYLDSRAAAAPASPKPDSPAHEHAETTVARAIPAAEMHALRQRFLIEGLERLGRYMAELDGRFPADEAARAVHQWVGTGGLLGYADISRLAREAEAVLRERPLDNAELRELLSALETAFRNPPDLA